MIELAIIADDSEAIRGKVTREKQLGIFTAQVENVRAVEAAWKQTVRAINLAYRANNLPAALVQTKLLGVIYSCYVEALFLKIIHTPYGFELTEIKEILNARSMTESWGKAVSFGLNKIPNAAKSNFRPNAEQYLKQLLSKYIETPATYRNKIAHGQWCVALNSENSDRNERLTAELQGNDCVKITNLKAGLEILGELIEALIESPDRAFMRDYFGLIDRLQNRESEFLKHTLEERLKRLRTKPIVHGNSSKEL